MYNFCPDFFRPVADCYDNTVMDNEYTLNYFHIIDVNE